MILTETAPLPNHYLIVTYNYACGDFITVRFPFLSYLEISVPALINQRRVYTNKAA
jgi:hypothetical protein